MRTLFEGARCSLNGVDKRVWCYCVESIASTWARLPRRRYSKLPQFNGLSPEQILNKLCPRFNSNSTLEFPRVFGCLCYFKIQIKAKVAGKLPDRWQRAIHLGFDEEKSGYTVGFYGYDKNGRLTWGDHCTQDIKFREEILISNLDDLLPGRDSITIKFDKLQDAQLSLNKFGERSDSVPRPGQPAKLARTEEQLSSAHELLWVEALDQPEVDEASTSSPTDSKENKQNEEISDPVISDNDSDDEQMSECPQESKSVAIEPDENAKSQEGYLSGSGPTKALTKQRLRAKARKAEAAAKAHGSKARKPRADKGKKRGNYKPRKPKPLGKENIHDFLASVYSTLSANEMFEDGESFLEGHVILGSPESLKGKHTKEWTAMCMLSIGQAL